MQLALMNKKKGQIIVLSLSVFVLLAVLSGVIPSWAWSCKKIGLSKV